MKSFSRDSPREDQTPLGNTSIYGTGRRRGAQKEKQKEQSEGQEKNQRSQKEGVR